MSRSRNRGPACKTLCSSLGNLWSQEITRLSASIFLAATLAVVAGCSPGPAPTPSDTTGGTPADLPSAPTITLALTSAAGATVSSYFQRCPRDGQCNLEGCRRRGGSQRSRDFQHRCSPGDHHPGRDSLDACFRRCNDHAEARNQSCRGRHDHYGSGQRGTSRAAQQALPFKQRQLPPACRHSHWPSPMPPVQSSFKRCARDRRNGR